MTASASVALLDELESVRAGATPGVWRVAKSGCIDAGDYDTVIGPGDVDCMSRCYGGTSTIDGDNLPADAACIVASVNAVPKLTAALRAVLAYADLLARTAGQRPEVVAADAAYAIRNAVASAFATTTKGTRNEQD